MSHIILDNIPFQVDLDALTTQWRIKENSTNAEAIKRLADEADTIARPKVLYTVGVIESKGERTVIIDGESLSSRVLRVNLEDAHQVFVFVATCGTEVEDWAKTIEGFMEKYWVDSIKEQAVYTALQYFTEHLTTHYAIGNTASMNPGSLEDWPLSQQVPVFKLLGDTETAIGVRLTDSFLMVPTKTVSGIRFATDEAFVNCQLCPKDDCPNRRAPHDHTLYGRKYQS